MLPAGPGSKWPPALVNPGALTDRVQVQPVGARLQSGRDDRDFDRPGADRERRVGGAVGSCGDLAQRDGAGDAFALQLGLGSRSGLPGLDNGQRGQRGETYSGYRSMHGDSLF
jgi:hypothetical protein